MIKDRDIQMVFRVNDEEKTNLIDAAAERNTNISEMIRDALDLYMELPPGFLKGIQKDADEYHLSVGLFVAYLFTAFTSMTAAMITEQIPTPVFNFAFRISEKGMMDAHSAGILTFKEVQAELREIKRMAERAKKTGKPMVIDDTKKTGILAYGLQGIKPEFKPKEMASAKGKQS